MPLDAKSWLSEVSEVRRSRVSKLQIKKALKGLSKAIPWELFLGLLEKGYSEERKSSASRRLIDPLILCKMLVLQQLFNLSDEELEFEMNHRFSFEIRWSRGNDRSPRRMTHSCLLTRAALQG